MITGGDYSGPGDRSRHDPLSGQTGRRRWNDVDQQLRWLRSQIVRTVSRDLLYTWSISAGVVLVLLQQATDLDLLTMVPWAVLASQLVVVARLGTSLATSPLSVGYLRRFIAHPCELVPLHDAEGLPHEVTDLMYGYDLHHNVTVADANVGSTPVFDLFRTADWMVTAAVGRESGTVVLVSMMNDGRILYTSDIGGPPQGELILNVVGGASLSEIALAHRQLIIDLRARGVEPVRSGTSVFAELMVREHSAYAALGPILGSFLELDGSRAPHRVQYRAASQAVLDLAMPTTSRAGAEVAPAPVGRHANVA